MVLCAIWRSTRRLHSRVDSELLQAEDDKFSLSTRDRSVKWKVTNASWVVTKKRQSSVLKLFQISRRCLLNYVPYAIFTDKGRFIHAFKSMKIAKTSSKTPTKACCHMNKSKTTGISAGTVKIPSTYDKVAESVLIWGHLTVLSSFSLFVNKNKCFGGHRGLCF